MILYFNVVSRSFDQAARYFKSLRLFLFTGTVDIPLQLLFNVHKIINTGYLFHE